MTFMDDVTVKPKSPKHYETRTTQIKLIINTAEGKQTVSDVRTICKRGNQVSAAVSIYRDQDMKFVVGQIAPYRDHSAQFEDDFLPMSWQLLGGSETANSFLHQLDMTPGTIVG